MSFQYCIWEMKLKKRILSFESVKIEFPQQGCAHILTKIQFSSVQDCQPATCLASTGPAPSWCPTTSTTSPASSTAPPGTSSTEATTTPTPSGATPSCCTKWIRPSSLGTRQLAKLIRTACLMPRTAQSLPPTPRSTQVTSPTLGAT